MAYSLNGSNQYIFTTSLPSDTLPFTLAMQFRPSRITADEHLVGFSATGGITNYAALRHLGGQAGDLIQAFIRGPNNTAGNISSTSGTSTNTWFNGAAVFTGLSSRTIYLDGGSSNTNTTTVQAPSIDRFTIGAWVQSSVIQHFSGLVAEVALWSADLTADEVMSVAKGFKPYRIRPQSLLFYTPLVRNLADLREARSLTNQGTATVADHPRVY